MPRKVIILSYYKSWSWVQVGGTDSYMRRLLGGLGINSDIEFECVFYGSDSMGPGKQIVGSEYFRSLNEACEYIVKSCTEIVVNFYIPHCDRAQFNRFRKANQNITFHSFMLFFPENWLKRQVRFSELLRWPYNGKYFCVSKRLTGYVEKRFGKAIYLPPIVPEDYIAESVNCDRGSINITFLGRIDPRKGAGRVVRLFSEIPDSGKYKCKIVGIHIPEDRSGADLHNQLLNQSQIDYVPVSRQEYSADVDRMVIDVLKETDIFVQPYRNLDSTLDTPLLLLEAIAAGCTVLTCPIGDVLEIYGESEFVIRDDFDKHALKLINNLSTEDLLKERGRVMKIKLRDTYSQEIVCRRFLDELNS